MILPMTLAPGVGMHDFFMKNLRYRLNQYIVEDTIKRFKLKLNL